MYSADQTQLNKQVQVPRAQRCERSRVLYCMPHTRVQKVSASSVASASIVASEIACVSSIQFIKYIIIIKPRQDNSNNNNNLIY